MPSANVFPLEKTEQSWVLSVDTTSTMKEQEQHRAAPVSIHFVVDNSASMGTYTKSVIDIFSAMVDTVATAPCSLTVFDTEAEVLSSKIKSSSEMMSLSLPSQGGTNIPSGIERALRVIYGDEMKTKNHNENPKKHSRPYTHHILILMSDGMHNRGPTPEQVFPTLGKTLIPATKLSVVLVGYSLNSSTSMGMLLKKSLETVPFKADLVQTIYFATNKTGLNSALSSLESGLNRALKGRFHNITMDSEGMLQNFGEKPVASMQVHLLPGKTRFSVLVESKEAPTSLSLDGEVIDVSHAEDISLEQLEELIQGLIDNTKVWMVASRNSARMVAQSVKRLGVLIDILESKVSKKLDNNSGDGVGPSLDLRTASSKDRVLKYRQIKTLCNSARVLRNQVIDIANFSLNQGGSDNQANFLNGRDMKFASKAMRRAGKRSEGMGLCPKIERKKLLKYLTSGEFKESLLEAIRLDTLENLRRLTTEELKSLVCPAIRNSWNGKKDVNYVIELHQKLLKHGIAKKNGRLNLDDYELTPGSKKLLESRDLASCLNKALHGDRQSYVSLSSPLQHLEEWLEFEENANDLESLWEMLMYAGFVGYPLIIGQRAAACQMNPYMLNIKHVRPTLIDTASICCANQAEVPMYGPEAGEPIKDVLVLIDPSVPNASKLVCSMSLLAEKFTSATISRDLNMYTGISMRIALHSNSLFALISNSSSRTADKRNETIIANLRRTFLNRAFQCPKCRFGPVDHFACSDLFAHHNENHRRGGRVNNACPKCEWFSSDLGDWHQWDGTVHPQFLENQKSPPSVFTFLVGNQGVDTANMDLVLRILYSFRKMRSLKMVEDCEAMLQKMLPSSRIADEGVDGDEMDPIFDFSTKNGIDGLSQLLIALLSSDDIELVESILNDDNTDVCLAMIREACQCDAKQRFRMKCSGDKEKTRAFAIQFLTQNLNISESTAPFTLSAMEIEPDLSSVRLKCSTEYELSDNIELTNEIGVAQRIAEEWCTVWSFARAFWKVLQSRGGGWEQLEKDMETSSRHYQDVLQFMKENAKFPPFQKVFNVREADCRLVATNLAIQGILLGAAEKKISGINVVGDAAVNVLDVLDKDQALKATAREMRIIIYLDRVAEKLALWKCQGEEAMFLKARAADLCQFADLVSAKTHVHAFDKPTFWGLWRSAMDETERRAIFLNTANDLFRYKHSTSNKGK